MIPKIGAALCAIALLALTGCPDEVPDTAPPVITLTGNAVIVVTIGGTFTDPGFDVTDNDPNYAGAVTPTIRGSDGTVVTVIDTATAGTYTITYTAPADAAGNSPVAVMRTVTVRPPNQIDIDGDLLIDIDTLEELNAMRHNLDGTSYRASAGGTNMLCGADAATACIGYELLGNLDFDTPASYASSTVNAAWRPTGGGTAIVAPDTATNAGWDPIGTSGSPFSARFNGNGFTISNLYARRGTRAGLFGTNSGAIEGIGVVDANIYGGAGTDFVGGLVGLNTGTVTASYTTGNVDGGAGIIDFVGGLVGENAGAITASYATGNVDGGAGDTDFVGGLVGRNTGTITASYATGDVDGGMGNNDRVGGLVGRNVSGGTITASYATGNADGGAGSTDRVGGLVGENAASGGTITASYGFGTETGDETAEGITRSDDASLSAAVANACALTVALSSTTPANRWDTAQWDFGTGTTERPFVRHNDALVPGQPTAERGC